MSLLHTQSAHRHQQPLILKFTISEMKFRQPKPHSHTLASHQNQLTNHAGSQLHLRRAMSYKSEKQKKISRLKEQVQAIGIQEQYRNRQQGHLRMLQTWNGPLMAINPHVLSSRSGGQESSQAEPLRRQLSLMLSTTKKSPALKQDISGKRRHKFTARRDIKPSPEELLTRKLEWQGKLKKPQNPQKLGGSKPKTSSGTKMPMLKQRYSHRPVVVRLSGWQLQISQQELLIG